MNSPTISPKSKAAPANESDASIPLVSFLVHELRNPLTNIILTSHLLESKMMVDNDGLYIDIIKRSSERINQLINDILKEQEKDKIQ
jgi:signal transduction histidine kinase